MALAANELSSQAVKIAEDTAQREDVNVTFSGAPFSVSTSVQVSGATGATEDEMHGGGGWMVLSNTGRLPITVLGFEATPHPSGTAVRAELTHIRLHETLSSSPRNDALLLAPGEAAAVRYSFEIPGDATEIASPSYRAVLSTGERIEVTLQQSFADATLPCSVIDAYSALGAYDNVPAPGQCGVSTPNN